MRMRRRPGSLLTRNKRGAALVEMAIVVSLLFILVFGLIDFGLVLRDYLALSQVAREAARSAAVGSDTTTVNSRIVNWGFRLGLSVPRIQATMECVDPETGATRGLGDSGEFNDAPAGSQIAIGLTYQHQMIAGRLLAMPNVIQLKSTMVMRRE